MTDFERDPFLDGLEGISDEPSIDDAVRRLQELEKLPDNPFYGHKKDKPKEETDENNRKDS